MLTTKELLSLIPATGTKNALKPLVWWLIGSKNDQSGLPGQVLRSSSDARGRSNLHSRSRRKEIVVIGEIYGVKSVDGVPETTGLGSKEWTTARAP